MSCDPTKWRSETIYWDDKSLKTYHPDTISYSVDNIQGELSGVKITWDNGVFYDVVNLDNYSYSIQDNPQECAMYRLKWEGTVTRRFTSNNQINTTNVNSSFYLFRGKPFFSYNNSSTTINITIRSTCPTFTTSFLVFGGSGQVYISDTLKITYDTNYQNVPPKKLVINDGGTIREFSITNTNSVNIQETYSQDRKEIIINGKRFSLSDENSIEVLCTDPIPQCPKGTIECDCGNGVIWCLQKQNDIYKVVTCIKY